MQYWSSALSGLSVPKDRFYAVLTRVATSTRRDMTGFITTDNKGSVDSYTATRYPNLQRGGFGGVAEYAEGIEKLHALLGGRIGHPYKPDQFPGARVILGLIEGYDIRAPRHTVEEVRRMVPHADVKAGEVASMRPYRLQGEQLYTEPVAIVVTDVNHLPYVFLAADQLRQHRFTVENPGHHTTYMVETRHCPEPRFTQRIRVAS